MSKMMLVVFVFLCSVIHSQEKTNFVVGSEVEYFDGLNWVESAIVQVGTDGRYLLYTNAAKTQTNWFKGDEIQMLYKNEQLVLETKTEHTEINNTYLYHVGDIISYKNNGISFETDILQLGADKTYLIFSNSERSATVWINQADVNLVRSNFKKEELVIADKQTQHSYTIRDSVECFDGISWKRGIITHIEADGQYQVTTASETRDYKPTDIRVPIANEQSSSGSEDNSPLKIGDHVKYYNGSSWIETEILMYNNEEQYQIFIDVDKTYTKWVERRDVKKIN